jgi:replicative DNA helicase
VTTPSGGKTELNLSVHRNGPTKTVTVAHHLRLSRFEFMYSSNPDCCCGWLADAELS